jgi:hypothetical protein
MLRTHSCFCIDFRTISIYLPCVVWITDTATAYLSGISAVIPKLTVTK